MTCIFASKIGMPALQKVAFSKGTTEDARKITISAKTACKRCWMFMEAYLISLSFLFLSLPKYQSRFPLKNMEQRQIRKTITERSSCYRCRDKLEKNTKSGTNSCSHARIISYRKLVALQLHEPFFRLDRQND